MAKLHDILRGNSHSENSKLVWQKCLKVDFKIENVNEFELMILGVFPRI